MILSRVQQGNVRSRVQVTEQEVDDYLASEEGQKRTAAVYHIGHLLLPLPKDATLGAGAAGQGLYERAAFAAGVRRRLRALHARSPTRAATPSPAAISAGASRAICPASSWMVPALETGAISEPVRSASGLHLVKLFGKRGGSGADNAADACATS